MSKKEMTDVKKNAVTLDSMPPVHPWSVAQIESASSGVWKCALDKYGAAARREMVAAYQAITSIYRDDRHACHVYLYLLSQGIVEMSGKYMKRLGHACWRRYIPYGGEGDHLAYSRDFSLLVPEICGVGMNDLTLEEAQIVTVSDLKKNRPKIDGAPAYGDGKMLRTFFCVANVAVLEAEFADGVFFVRKGDVPKDKNGFLYEKHVFRPYSIPSKEGLVVMYRGEEVKLKFFPTVEVLLYNGYAQGQMIHGAPVVPVSLTVEVGLGDGGYYFLGERYGHPIGKLESLHKKVSLHAFPDLYRNDCPDSLQYYELVLENDAIEALSWHQNDSGVVITFDHCYGFFPHVHNLQDAFEAFAKFLELNPEGYTLCYNYMSAEVQVVQGAKMSFLGFNGMAVFRDGAKPWDFIGGKLLEREQPLQALLREVREESGIELCREDVQYKCLSTSLENGTLFITHVFEMITLKNIKSFCAYNLDNINVPWLKRLIACTNWVPREVHLEAVTDHVITNVKKLSVSINDRVLNTYKDWASAYPEVLNVQTVVRRKVFSPAAGIYVFPSYIHFSWKKIPPFCRYVMISSLLPKKYSMNMLCSMMGLSVKQILKFAYDMGGGNDQEFVYFVT